MSNVESQSTDSRQEALMTNEISKDLENNLNNANPKEVAEILDKTVTLPDHDPVTMNIEKKKTGEMEIL